MEEEHAIVCILIGWYKDSLIKGKVLLHGPRALTNREEIMRRANGPIKMSRSKKNKKMA
jgi:hypothetical protein